MISLNQERLDSWQLGMSRQHNCHACVLEDNSPNALEGYPGPTDSTIMYIVHGIQAVSHTYESMGYG